MAFRKHMATKVNCNVRTIYGTFPAKDKVSCYNSIQGGIKLFLF